MKKFNNYLSILLVVFMMLTMITPIYAEVNDTVIMYRVYNPNSGEHFYTSNSSEKNNLIRLGWNDEGIGWFSTSSGDPVYRLYNAYAGEHHYTLNKAEKNNLIKLGWKDEGIGWYSAKDTIHAMPIYREYNPNAFANNHNYTYRDYENNGLILVGWKYEGIGWYGVWPNSSTSTDKNHQHNYLHLTGVGYIETEKQARYGCNFCADLGTLQIIGDELTEETINAHLEKVKELKPNHPGAWWTEGSWHGAITWFEPYPWETFYCTTCGQYMHEHNWRWEQSTRKYECSTCFQWSDDKINGYTADDRFDLSYDFDNSGIDWVYTYKVSKENTGLIYLTSFGINYNSRSMTLGDTCQLKITIFDPADYNVPVSFSYKSLDPSVATVDQNGLVTAVGVGVTTVRVESDNGKYSDCIVRVYADDASNAGVVTSARLLVNGVDITDGSVTLSNNSKYVLTVSTVPEKAIYNIRYSELGYEGDGIWISGPIEFGLNSWRNESELFYTNPISEISTYKGSGYETIRAVITDVNGNEIVLSGKVAHE